LLIFSCHVCDTNYMPITKMPKQYRPNHAYFGAHAYLESLAASL